MRSLFIFLSFFATYLDLVVGFWRLPCQARSGLARIDPIKQPGGLSGHVHGIYGGNSTSTIQLLSKSSFVFVSHSCNSQTLGRAAIRNLCAIPPAPLVE